MEPIKFPEANKNLQKPQGWTDEQCGPLPVYNDGQQSVSCWKLTWRERFSAFFFGRVWLFVHFGHTQPPVYLEAKRRIFTVKWTCSDSAHHEHRTKFGAWWCGRRQYFSSVIRSWRKHAI